MLDDGPGAVVLAHGALVPGPAACGDAEGAGSSVLRVVVVV